MSAAVEGAGGTDGAGAMSARPAEAKRALRRRVLAARRELSPAEIAAAGADLAALLLATPEVVAAGRVAAYVAVGTEPDPGPLVAALTARGVPVLLPVLQPDGDLDWALAAGGLGPGPRGLREPAGPRLGPDAVAAADVVLVPAVAVGRDGVRLGRGGGSYDRALARAAGWTCALLHRGEVVPTVPAQPHDRAVAAAATPDGLLRFPAR